MSLQFFNINEEDKKTLLDILGYDLDKSGLILDRKTKKPHICPISKEKVYLKNASILPWNSNIIINTTALSISEYLSQLPDKCKSD